MQKTKQFLFLKNFNPIPQFAIITGSGIKLFNNYKPIFKVKYGKKRRVQGHEGILKLYKIKNKNILVFSGRHHLYEGLSMVDVVKNIRLCYELGVKKIIITNAAGGLDKNFKPGDLMLITGFIDLMQPTERGILSGIIQPAKKIVEARLIAPLFTKFILRKFKKEIKTGIYAGVLGPSYETYSEIKLLQNLGVRAVGMSTVPELICAKSLGLDYAGISIISNVWNKNHKPSHKNVLAAVKKANKKLNDLVVKIVGAR